MHAWYSDSHPVASVLSCWASDSLHINLKTGIFKTLTWAFRVTQSKIRRSNRPFPHLWHIGHVVLGPILGICDIWRLDQYFYKPISTWWIMWSSSCRQPPLMQDIFSWYQLYVESAWKPRYFKKKKFSPSRVIEPITTWSAGEFFCQCRFFHSSLLFPIAI